MVPLNKLWTIMINTRLCKTSVKAVKDFYCGCTRISKGKQNISLEFEVTKGLRQGCMLAPMFSKIYLEDALTGSASIMEFILR